MNARACVQVPLVEAHHDGRLGPHELASLDRHMAGCAECAARRDELVRLREAIRAPLPNATPLEHQRARAALLRRAADEGPRAAESVRHRDRRFAATLAFAAALAAVALVVGWTWGRASAPVAVATAAAPVGSATTVTPDEGARFERVRGGGLDAVNLTSGTLRVSVGAAGPERFVVRTSDAELEPKAASFRVDASDGKIRSVVVERGMVDVRYAGFIAVIPAGGSWRASDVARNEAPPASAATAVAADSSVASPAPSAPSSVAMASPPAVDPSPPRREHAAPPPPPPSPRVAAANPPLESAPAASISPPPPPPNSFGTAMRALDGGDYESAANAMAEFAKTHPDDARADEADYVQAVALQRAGRTEAAKAAARSYLARWPNGAHRAQAKTIASD